MMPQKQFRVRRINLSRASPKMLASMSRRYSLSLSIEEMTRLQGYFRGLGREPTDVELQAMAQAWSEHCSYKSSRIYLKKYLGGLRTDYTILAMEDDAGVVEFDSEHAYVIKMESHNHPSAVEPYGGAATGVGGVIRDVLCMGAKPVALLDSLFFGKPDFEAKDHLSTRFLMGGVVGGIRDYGNRVGIPNVSGSVDFHESYNTNPLVNAGCVGIAKKGDIRRSFVTEPGTLLVLAGGRTGRDGIHGVTFASRSIRAGDKENARSVQLGNPIVKEPLIHAVLESNDRGLIKGMKDLGGGGLSSAVGEFCLGGGLGGEIDLTGVKLKEEGMEPWEIWISESQERMLLGVDKKDLPALQAIMDSWDVEYSVIGRVVEGTDLKIVFKGKKVLELDLNFMTSGPLYARHYIIQPNSPREVILPKEMKRYDDLILDLAGSPQGCSRQRIIRQYDYTVMGRTYKAPLTGNPNTETHSDSAIITPVPGSNRGLCITSGTLPSHCAVDPYRGTLSSLSEGFRNILCSGGNPHSLVDSLNFGDPEDPVVMGQFVESVRAIGDFCRKLGLPVVAGNVSFYNRSGKSNIVPTPTMLLAGIIEDVNNAIPNHFMEEGSVVVLAGRQMPGLCGSMLLDRLGMDCSSHPDVDLDELQRLRSGMLSASRENLLLSAHDVTQGGLVMSVLEMSLGRSIGVDIDLTDISSSRSSVKMFSEFGNCVILEVKEEMLERLRSIFKDIQVTVIGRTGGKRIVINDLSLLLADIGIDEARKKWEHGLDELV